MSMEGDEKLRADANSDEELVGRYLKGEVEAFNLLVKRWQKPIYSFACRLTGDREEARDICQEVFILAFRQLSQLRERSKFSSWLYKIALNQCRLRRRSEKQEQLPLEEADALWEERIADPEQSLRRKEMNELLRKAFSLIPEEQRAVIVMKEYQGLKFQEIAEIMNCPESTVKSRMYFGLKALRRELRRLSIRREL